ncbi:hypothetical protein [Clostridium sp. AM49-4BH]|jgi:hypothetical protein|uniref:hypothetical protein n=1 Tax=Clostridium sp. AM49-4BH TaxID=2293035 RepID=UPI000E516978|nr:hypothetical protein [Clostridium sp. AM49-4BH]RHQ09922.1 hypothetical protein DW981_12395 [Clostridium sp. AM49-4BH]
MEEVKTLAMLQELSEKIDTMIDLLRNIESNTSSTESNTDDIFYAKSELQDINTNLQKVLNKID